MSRRYLAIWLPLLPADRIMRQKGWAWKGVARDSVEQRPPLVVVEKIKGAMRLVAISREARHAGLSVGLSLADARARIPHLWVEEADHAANAALLDAIAEDCDRFTPIVGVDAPDGLTLDITGCAGLFGGEAEMRLRISQRLNRAGLHVRTVIAGAPEAARALARHGMLAIIPPGEDAQAVRNLPIIALNLNERDRVAISRAGLKTIGALADRPSQVFSARFGEAMSLKLARVQGLAPAPFASRRPVPMLWVEQRFAEPIGRSENIEAALGELSRTACEQLGERREGGRVFEASFHRTDGAVRRLTIETGRPQRDPAALLRLFREKLDALADPLDPGFGFDLMRLAVLHADPLSAIQSGLDGRAVDADAVADLADRLATRFGPARVLRFAAIDTHNPERAARAVAVSETPAPWPRPEADEPPLRPLHMFDPPQAVVVTMAEVPDGPPRRFTWRKLTHDVVRAEGPERIAPEWWRTPDAATRDYYRVEDAHGRRFWLFRTGLYGAEQDEVRWYMHGLFA